LKLPKVKIVKYTSIFKSILIISTMVMVFGGSSCSKHENPSIDLATAVDHVITQAVELKVKSYLSGDEATLLKGTVTYGTITGYITGFRFDRAQPRHQEVDGKIAEVTIPYTKNYMLTFKLGDGSYLDFGYAGDEIWFETEEMIYGGIVVTNLENLLKQSLTEK
jgi:hypothetical protein